VKGKFSLFIDIYSDTDNLQFYESAKTQIKLNNNVVFTARCTLVQSAVLRSYTLSACLSVRLSVHDIEVP